MITHIAAWITWAAMMREMALRLPLVLLLLLLAPGHAVSEEPNKAVADCNQFEDSARQIRGCTEFIRIGKALGPNLAVAYTNRGIAYAARGDHKHAIEDFSEAIRLAPDDPHPYYNRGNAYYDLKNYKQALADYTAAIERGPEMALAYYNRGLTHQRLGHRNESIEDFQKALSIDPGSQAARDRLNKLGVH
jgi:tetratricopeptide (TPR) repeat protein